MNGLRPGLIVLEACTACLAGKQEKQWIRWLVENGNHLVNSQHSGSYMKGTGYYRIPEWIKREYPEFAELISYDWD
jgi:hypothetical protein